MKLLKKMTGYGLFIALGFIPFYGMLMSGAPLAIALLFYGLSLVLIGLVFLAYWLVFSDEDRK